MLTHFPKVTLRIYEHALLFHVPDLISGGTLSDGSSWFLEAYHIMWKHQLLSHSNGVVGSMQNQGLQLMSEKVTLAVPGCMQSALQEKTLSLSRHYGLVRTPEFEIMQLYGARRTRKNR
jgi:hypothetical protein